MKLSLTYLLATITAVIYAQVSTDSIRHLPVVEKIEIGNDKYLRGIVTQPIASTNNLSDLLRENSSIFLKNYGNGQLTSISFRGSNAQQTDILWNGVKLNSPTLGQTDLSLFSIGMADKFKLNPFSKNGNTGGEVEMLTQSNFDSLLSAEVVFDYGSFNTFRSYGKLQVSNRKISGVTRINYLQSENNYPFLNYYKPENPIEKLTNAKVKVLSFMQQFAAKINSHNTIEYILWLNDALRQIPPVISKPQSRESQSDYSIRNLVTWKSNFKKIKTEYTSAFLLDVIDYKNPEISLAEKTTTQAFRNNLDIHIDSLKIFSVHLTAGYDFEKAIVPSYGKNRMRHIEKAAVTLKCQPMEELNLQITLHEHIYGKSFSPVSPAFALHYFHKAKYTPDKISLQLKVARNFRFPTLNDLYWVPGGNPNLKPEKSWDGELSIGYSHPVNFSISSTVFCRYVTDWIQWIPGNSYWQPMNIKRMLSRGQQLNLKAFYGNRNFSFHAQASYTYTRATNLAKISTSDQSKGKQVIYVPQHAANISFAFEYKYFFLRLINSYTDAVFVTTDNSQKLNGYYLLDIEVGKDFNVKNYTFGVSFKINNVTGANYQTMIQRPMPGRSFEGALHLKFGK